MLKILQAPNPILGQKAKNIKQIDKAILTLIRDMDETLNSARDPEGVGLAAPQIGKSLQLFLIKETPQSKTQIFINPKIIKFIDIEIDNDNSSDKEDGVTLEGCLSLYNIWGEVQRHHGLVLSYLDENGKKQEQQFNGFLATIIQHEYDHLQGILFPKRVLEQKKQLYKSSRNKKGEQVFEEIEI